MSDARVARYVREFDADALVYLVSSATAVGLCLVSFVLYAAAPSLRTHPSSLIFWNLVADCFFSLKFLVTSAAWLARPPAARPALFGRSFHLIPDSCTSAALYGEFWGVATGGLNFIWVLNFYRELRAPLASTRSSVKWYHAYVWTLAVIGVIIVLAGHTFTPSGDLTCWVSIHSVAAWYTDALIVIYGVFGLYTLAYLVLWRLRSQLVFARSRRAQLLKHHAWYVLVFVVCWLPPLIWRHVFEATHPPDAQQPRLLRLLTAAMYSGQAVLICLVRMSEPSVRAVIWRLLTTCSATPPDGEYADLYYDDDDDPLLFDPDVPGASIQGASSPQSYGTVYTSSSATPRFTPRAAALRLRTPTLSSPEDVRGWGVGSEFRVEMLMCMLSGVCQNLYDAKVTATQDAIRNASLPELRAMSNARAQYRFKFKFRGVHGDDFSDAGTSVSSDMHIGALSGSSRHRIRVYAADLFEAIRETCFVTATEVAAVISPDLYSAGLIRASFSAARSGSFFCFSSDSRFIVKTVPQSEVSVILELLPDYYIHRTLHPSTLLCPLLGLFALDVDRFETVHLLVMGNVLGAFDHDTVYDLKGSTVNRGARAPSSSPVSPSPAASAPSLLDTSAASPSSSSLLMDNDFDAAFPAGLAIAPRARRRLLHQLEVDVRLLTAHNLMDFSVLLGVANLGPTEDAPPDSYGDPQWLIASHPDRTHVYGLGIIDLFQRYNVGKKVERSLKKIRHASRRVDISAQPPDEYATRLIRFITSSVFPDHHRSL